MRLSPPTLLTLLALSTTGCGILDTSATPPDPFAGRNVLSAPEAPWEELENGWRRQVLFSGELTLVVLEATGPGTGPIPLHNHPNDQISYVIDGEIEAQVGDEVRRLGPGGFFRVPGGAPHGIRVLTARARLLDAFTPPREDFRQPAQ